MFEGFAAVKVYSLPNMSLTESPSSITSFHRA
jgi:hypothetical protein